MFKKKILLSFIVAIVLVFTVACAENSGSDSEESQEKYLDFITGDPDGTWAAIGTGISDKFNNKLDSVEMSSKPGSGSVGNPEAVSNGKGDIGMSYNPFLIKAVNGEEPYSKEMNNLKAVASMTPTVVHYIQNANTDANSLEELISEETKMTFGIPPKGQGSNYIGSIIFESQGIDDIESSVEGWGGSMYYGEMSNITDAWSNKQIDSFMTTLNVPGSAVEESMAANKGKIMNMGENLSDILVNEQGFEPYKIPKGTYNNQDEDVDTVGLSIIVFTREDVSDEVIYELTKTIYENEEYLENVHSSFKEFDKDKMAENLSLDLHSGAEKFYKEKDLID